MADLAGTTIGSYRLESLLGRGGMADVYYATHVSSGRRVALKLVRIEEVANGERRFLSEAQLLSNLDHPDIVHLYEFFESKGYLALAIEFVPGKCLDEILEDRKMLPAEALELFKKILPPVAYLHEQGIVHRDIKPSNIRVMPNGDIKLLDFGIARATGSKRLTRVGRVVGTPAYLSPEVRAGDEPKATADVWALGMLLKECAEDWCNKQKPGLKNMRLTSAERSYKRVLAKCLERKPEDRYRDAHAIERDIDLERLTGGMAISSGIDSKTIAGFGIGAAVLVAVLVFLFKGGPPDPPAPSQTTTGGVATPAATTGTIPPPRSTGGSAQNPLAVPDSGGAGAVASGTLPVRCALVGSSDTAELFIDDHDAGPVTKDPAMYLVSPGAHKFEVQEGGKVVAGPETDTVAGQDTYLNFSIPIPNQ